MASTTKLLSRVTAITEVAPASIAFSNGVLINYTIIAAIQPDCSNINVIT
jgi:hypothetical protein